jgi:hypothetical protein
MPDFRRTTFVPRPRHLSMTILVQRTNGNFVNCSYSVDNMVGATGIEPVTPTMST